MVVVVVNLTYAIRILFNSISTPLNDIRFNVGGGEEREKKGDVEEGGSSPPRKFVPIRA